MTLSDLSKYYNFKSHEILANIKPKLQNFKSPQTYLNKRVVGSDHFIIVIHSSFINPTGWPFQTKPVSTHIKTKAYLLFHIN